ncbi:hypothetical protein OC845_005879 [Tilletia horrida]|nr:hypothetical protein OC845_005879 [Tilletia horrida]
MTRGILKGLDWNHVMIAGGLPLAVLTSVTDEQAAVYQGSDIDLYLYGLGPEQATAKLQEIEKVFKANLPTNETTGEKMKYAVLRNSQTVTFVPEVYPNRRLQVVLKLCPNPMAVLLNFDLDQVGVAYDGAEVWMLPRTARAIVTSYTVFTMDLIHGSFLSSRKATQDQRVFKYAKRGYGLRFLPSYIESLPHATVSIPMTDDTNGPEISLTQDELRVTLIEERKRIDWWLAQQDRDRWHWGPDSGSIPMKALDARSAISPELAERSSLSGWQQFARHVSLWEYSQMGYFSLELKSEEFCSAGYEDDPLSYQDGPEFSWDDDFTLEQLRKTVDESSQRETDRFHASLAFSITPRRLWDMSDGAFESLKADHEARHMRPRRTLRRTIMATTLDEAFSQPLVAFVHLPRNFRAHAEPKLSNTPSRFEDVTLPGAPEHKPVPPYAWVTVEHEAWIRTDADFVLSYWIQDGTRDGRLIPHWQLVDRQADEIHEIVHAFRRGHRDLNKHTGYYGVQEDWAMLNVSRSVVFGRFKITKEKAEEMDWIGYEDKEDDGSFDSVPRTAEEWIARTKRFKRLEDAYWVLWYKCRLPPADLLGQIRALKG